MYILSELLGHKKIETILWLTLLDLSYIELGRPKLLIWSLNFSQITKLWKCNFSKLMILKIFIFFQFFKGWKDDLDLICVTNNGIICKINSSIWFHFLIIKDGTKLKNGYHNSMPFHSSFLRTKQDQENLIPLNSEKGT